MATNASGTSDPTARVSDPIQAPSWSAVWALTLCVATLIASEFMPVSLLTPIATDLHMTEGRAGQAIAVSGFFAVVTSLMISSATRGIDRRRVLLWLVALMMASGVMVAMANSVVVFMAGRALLGIVIGGFWSMSAATACCVDRRCGRACSPWHSCFWGSSRSSRTCARSSRP